MSAGLPFRKADTTAEAISRGAAVLRANTWWTAGRKKVSGKWIEPPRHPGVPSLSNAELRASCNRLTGVASTARLIKPGRREHWLRRESNRAKAYNLDLPEASPPDPIHRIAISPSENDNQQVKYPSPSPRSPGHPVRTYHLKLRQRPIRRTPFRTPEENRHRARMERISRLVDCPDVVRGMTTEAYHFWRDLNRWMEPHAGKRVYAVTREGVHCKARLDALQKAGWEIAWVASGGETGDNHHMHLAMVPPLDGRGRQMPEQRAIAAINRALGVPGLNDHTGVLKSRAGRRKWACYMAKNRKHKMTGYRGRRTAMPVRCKTRLTPGEKNLLRPRQTRAERAAWLAAVEVFRRRLKRPRTGPQYWIWRLKSQIMELAWETGPDFTVYHPQGREFPLGVFQIDSILADGLKYNIGLNNLHREDLAGHAECMIQRPTTPSEKVQDEARAGISYDSWMMPTSWPAIAVQLIGIYPVLEDS